MCTKLIKLTSLIITLFLFGNLHAQQLWTVAKGPQLTSSKNAIAPNVEKASFNLDWKAFKKVLKDAPLRFSEASKTQDLVVAFPDATGELQDFVGIAKRCGRRSKDGKRSAKALGESRHWRLRAGR